ncbi:transcription factor [Clostridium butyricum]|uniref:Transcription factor n=1 Tax=Clostridium butyricum TaxID=1492 RepID=A0A6L9EP92_CLOBU|nr:transcription factor [Clostridium butyricum]
MEQILISRETLAKRWDVTTRTVINYEQEGMITRNPNIPVPRYNLEEIMRLEGTELSPLSPLERRRLEKSIEELTKERDYWKSKVETVKSALA